MLNNHTYFSLRYGTFSEEELLMQAKQLGYKQIALTDINNTSACLNFVRQAEKYEVKPVLGIDFRKGAWQSFVGIAKNNDGFQELNQLLSYYNHNKFSVDDFAPDFNNAFIIYPFNRINEFKERRLKPNEFIGVKWQDLNKVKMLSQSFLQNKMVIMQTASFRNKSDFNMHRLLRAIDKNTLLSKLPIAEQAQADACLISYTELLTKFQDFPYIIRNTELLLEQCEIHFHFSGKREAQNKKHYTDGLQNDLTLLKKLCSEGLSYRYEKLTPQIESRLEKELQLIEKTGFVSFFLINWDIVQYAKNKGYFHVGRGSGANSIVAYLLGITDVDPIELDLYFERFMNLYRANPPDFDLDFSWRDREDVTRYIFERFGKENQVALLATYNTFQHSAAVRELGKVFGLPTNEIDLLSSAKFNASQLDQLSRLTLQYAQMLQNVPNHLSIHAGGILISEKPIQYFSATNMPPKGFPTTQFDMVIAEDVGLYKFDILGQRGLGKIKDAVQIVKQNQTDNPEIDIHQVKSFIQDKKINALISKAKCIGCFYVESPAMRMLLKKLKVDNYLGLVAASSIIRPGVAKSGMMREYILRHKNVDRRKDAHPILGNLMPETYGIMVYQEDVIKVAHYFAGLELDEADVLRRGMSGKFRSRDEFHKIKQKFYDNCVKKGYDEQLTNEVWKQIESFAGYAFAKGHSASYAVESYQSLFLKCYYPLEYMVATLNNGGGFYRPEIYIHEARLLGAKIHAPDVNKSQHENIINKKDIYLGFQMLKGFEYAVAAELIEERTQNGLFTSFENFLTRVRMTPEQIEILIRINAFRFTGENKRNLLWKALLNVSKKPLPKQKPLFSTELRKFQVPELESEKHENTFDEMELLGFSLSNPFALLKDELEMHIFSRDMKAFTNANVVLYGYLVSVKNTHTAKGKRMNFGTFLDKNGDWIDTVHFPPVAQAFPFRGGGIYKIEGRVVDEFDFLSIEVEKMQKMALIPDPRFEVKDDAKRN